MAKVKNYIGIDISKNWLDIAVLSSSHTTVFETRCNNTIQDLHKLKTSLKEKSILLNSSTLVVCEHTGIYKKCLVDFLLAQKCRLCVEVALRIKKSLGITRGKNDKIDARRIAQYAILNQNNLSMWKNPRKIVGQLKDLLLNRDRLLKKKKALQTSIGEYVNFHTKKYTKYFSLLNEPAFSGMDKSINLIEKEIQMIADNDKAIRSQIDLLVTIPGIGILQALFFICYTHEFSICKTGKQLACYAGVAPFEFKSGSSVSRKSKVDHIANKRLKTLLHMPAMMLTRSKGEFGVYYKRKVAEGKNKSAVINALKNKLILRIAAVIKRRTPYVSAVKILKAKRSLVIHKKSS